jgi:hypothetical protein
MMTGTMKPRSYLAMAALLTLVSGHAVQAAEPSEIVRTIIALCVGSGSEEQLKAQGKGELALTLRKLRSGDLGVSGSVDTSFTKAEWQGVIGGISSQMGQVQADQVDKVRTCIQPYIAGIMAVVLKTEK